MTMTSYLLHDGHHHVPPPEGLSLAGLFEPSVDALCGRAIRDVGIYDRHSLLEKAEMRAAALALSEERLRFTHKAGRIGSWTLDLKSMEFVASDGCKSNFGRDPWQSFTYAAWIEAVHPDDRDRMRASFAASVQGQTDYDIEYRISYPDGVIHWIQSRGQASYWPDGTGKTIAGISLDITDRKRIETHRDLLAKELGHRVKNTLATIQYIVRTTLRMSGSLKDAEVALDARIVALAAAHDVLIRDSWEGATLADVVAVALRPFGVVQDGRFTFDGPAIRIPSRVALAFAMAFHELATNAVKYGALSTDKGHVALTWQIVSGESTDVLRFSWQESDGPSVSAPTRAGFGSRMIERALAAEIGGTAQIEYLQNGIVFTAETRLSQVQQG